MNLNLVGQGRFEASYVTVKNPITVLKDFSHCLKESLKHKKLMLLIDSKIGGEASEIQMTKDHGVLLEADLYK